MNQNIFRVKPKTYERKLRVLRYKLIGTCIASLLAAVSTSKYYHNEIVHPGASSSLTFQVIELNKKNINYTRHGGF